MVNHYWDGKTPERTACGESFAVPYVSSRVWGGGVSCPDCLAEKSNPNNFRVGEMRTTSEVKSEADPWAVALASLLGEVQALMQDRHRKYGSGNIAKRGIPGILVRLDDKLARIDNGDMDYADESYRDAWMDVVGYGLIALMALDGNWPGLDRLASADSRNVE